MITNITNFFIAGGIVAYPLLLFSLAAGACIIERFVFWLRINRRQRKVVREVFGLYRQDADSAILFLKRHGDLPISRIFLEALELEEANAEEFQIALESATQAEIPSLKRFNTVFDTIIALSPLLGLLGTILGLMQSFSALNIGGMGGDGSGQVTGGISEALVSTVMGLVVAIFTLFFSNIFNGFYQRKLAYIQEVGGQLELLHRRYYEKVSVVR